MTRRYGLLHDAQTSHAEHTLGAVKIASHSDLRDLFPPVINQGNIGDCTCASGVAIRFALAKIAGVANPPTFDPISLYFWERQHDGTLPTDAGSRLSTTVYVGENIGFAPATKPYDTSTYNSAPSEQVKESAGLYKIHGAKRLTNLQGILETLSEGIPVHLGILVYESMEYETTARDGIVPMPEPWEQCMGGHAICAVGHDNDKRMVLCRNSWGTDWGIGGYFYLPYDYFQSDQTFMSAWRWAV